MLASVFLPSWEHNFHHTMRHLICLLALAAVIAGQSACSTRDTFQSPAPRAEFSATAARQQAQHDFAIGKPEIYSAGGYAVFEPGIQDNEKALVADLPINGRLAGCTNPLLMYSEEYATAYNQEIIALIKKKG